MIGGAEGVAEESAWGLISPPDSESEDEGSDSEELFPSLGGGGVRARWLFLLREGPVCREKDGGEKTSPRWDLARALRRRAAQFLLLSCGFIGPCSQFAVWATMEMATRL